MAQVDPQKTRVRSWVILFLLRVKKIKFRSGIFRIELGQVKKFWPILPCLMPTAKPYSQEVTQSWGKKKKKNFGRAK